MEKFEEKFSEKRISYSMKESDLELPELNLTAFDWLSDAQIYNKDLLSIDGKWIKYNSDIIVLLFTSLGVDKERILRKFYKIYETSKYTNIPIEVIFFSMDETENNMLDCYDNQANWFLVRFDDVLVTTLMFMYEVTCLPQLIVLSNNLKVISRNGIQDILEYGQNAIISWLGTPSKTKQYRSFKNETLMYGPEWHYLGKIAKKPVVKPLYRTGQVAEAPVVKPPLRWPRTYPAQDYTQNIAQGSTQNIAQGFAQNMAQGSAQNMAQGSAQNIAQGDPWAQTQDLLSKLGADLLSRQVSETPTTQEKQIKTFPKGVDNYEGPTNEY